MKVVDVFVSGIEIPQPSESTASQSGNPGPTPHQQDDVILSEVKVPVDKPSTDSQPTLQVDPLQTQNQIEITQANVRVDAADLPAKHRKCCRQVRRRGRFAHAAFA